MSPIHDFASAHLDRRCFIIGSGPSLREQDLTPLAHEITFTCNRGYLLWQRLGGPSTYWCVEDVLDVQQFGVEFQRLNGTVKLIADDIGDLGDGSVLVPFTRERFTVEQGPKFALEPPFMWGATVSYMMLQLAAFMGCNPIYLLGHDFSYKRATVDVTQHQDATPTWLNVGPDTDHFSADYWPEGSTSFAADLPRMYAAFVAAKAACDAIGTRIVNLTPGSKLDVFEKAALEEILR